MCDIGTLSPTVRGVLPRPCLLSCVVASQQLVAWNLLQSRGNCAVQSSLGMTAKGVVEVDPFKLEAGSYNTNRIDKFRVCRLPSFRTLRHSRPLPVSRLSGHLAPRSSGRRRHEERRGHCQPQAAALEVQPSTASLSPWGKCRKRWLLQLVHPCASGSSLGH